MDENDHYDHSKYVKNDSTLSIVKEECEYQYNVPNRKNSYRSLESFF